MATRVRKDGIRQESDTFSPQLGPLLWSHIDSFVSAIKANIAVWLRSWCDYTTSSAGHLRYLLFFGGSLIGQWGAVFPNHIKNDSQWQSSQLGPFFRPWMNKWNWLHFGWPLLTYYSVWNSLKHHWCQSTFDLTFPSGTPPWEEAFYSYCIHETATYTF